MAVQWLPFAALHAAFEKHETTATCTGSRRSLVGWQCHCETMPPLDYVDANLLATATDFAWTLGVSEFSRRGGHYGETVFIEPSAF